MDRWYANLLIGAQMRTYTPNGERPRHPAQCGLHGARDIPRNTVQARGATNRTRQVLVVDDDRGQRAVLRRLLKRAGFDVCEAENGQLAYEQLTGASDSLPGLIIVDGHMPAMNGWELAAKMTQDPRLAPVPVIMVSGAEQSLARVRGIREFFEKPFDVSRLMAAVRRHCLPGESSAVPVETH
jgi:CheY-like chemotaxis protein